MGSKSGLMDVVKANSPMFVRRLSRRVKQWLKDRRNRAASAREVFSEIYLKQTWGSTGGMNFYSGPGSDAQAAAPYCAFVKRFAEDHQITRVVDLGCGDFRVGSLIAPGCARYVGVDIVEPLIAENRRLHATDGISFECLDITTDPLPDAELCLIREVLQHLSNAQIKEIMIQVRKYPYVLFTDVQPTDPSGYRVNRDKIQGDSSRIVHRSMLRLDKPPFNIPDVENVFETDAVFASEWAPFGSSFKLRTFLLRH